jgi:hypothetical protein
MSLLHNNYQRHMLIILTHNHTFHLDQDRYQQIRNNRHCFPHNLYLRSNSHQHKEFAQMGKFQTSTFQFEDYRSFQKRSKNRGMVLGIQEDLHKTARDLNRMARMLPN